MRLTSGTALLFVASAAAFTPAVRPQLGAPDLRSTHASAASARKSLVLAAAAATPEKGVGVAPSIINLAKNIVGSGVLALSAGVAAFSSSKLALLPSMLLLLICGGLSAYSYALIARVGVAVGANTYRDTWAKVFGQKTVILPDATVVFMTAAAGLSYSIIVGDMFSSIAQLAGAPALLRKSNAWIGLLSVFVLLPLSLLRDLSSLAIGSVIGTGGTVYTALFMWLRIFDGSYRAGGKFAGSIAAAPSFAAATAAKPLINPSILVLVSMLASAFLAHYNAPKFYDELAAPADGSSKLPRFNFVVYAAFAGAAALMGAIMCAGFLTFGGSATGLILNNYATSDTLALVARLGIGFSIIFSYPLNFVGLRDGIFGMIGKRDLLDNNAIYTAATVAIMSSMSIAALFLKDLGLVVALGGAILGSALVYIFPALMAIGEKGGAITSRLEKGWNYVLTALGVVFAILGAVMCLK